MGFLFKNKYSLVLFVVLLFFALLLRGQETFSKNFIFLIDQGRDMLAVKQILYDHHLTLIGPYTSLAGVFQGPLWYYLLVIPTFLTNGDPWGGLVLMLLISMSTLILAYVWMLKLFGLKAALITLILFTISPEAIAAATYTWNPHPMWLLLTLYMFFLYQVVRGKQKFYLPLFPTITLMFHFQMALGILVLFATLFSIGFFGFKKTKKTYMVSGLILSLLFLLPQMLFDIRHDFLMSKSVLATFSGSNHEFFFIGGKKDYIGLVLNHLSFFVLNFKTSFLHDSFFMHFPTLVFVFLVVMTLIAKRENLINPNEYLFIKTVYLIVVLVILLTLLYPFPFRYWFLTGFQVFYILIAGLLLSKAWRFFYGKLALVFLCTLFFIHTIDKLDRLYIHTPNEGGVAKIKGKLEAIEIIYKDAKDKPFGLFTFTPPVYTYAYEYLIWWQGRNTYSYIPHQEKKGLFYLLIEPDPSAPWTYKGWLETVIKTGKVVFTKELPSGFIIQKRTGG